MLSIVIPTYGAKGVELTRACLESFWTSGLGHPLAKDNRIVPEIVVVDDGSDEAVVRQLESLCLEHGASLLHSEQNTAHFARNVNAGLARTSGQAVFVINNDVTLLPNCLQTLMVFMGRGGVGLVAPKLLYPNETVQFGGMTYVPNPSLPTIPGYFDHVFRGQHRWTAGACLTRDGLLTGAVLGINRWTIDTIGYFDERFPLTCEDVDYCLMAMHAGLAVTYVGVAEAFHHEGATRGNTPETKAAHPELNAREAESLEFLFDKWGRLDFTRFIL